MLQDTTTSSNALQEENLFYYLLLKQLLESLHIKVETKKDATVLQSMHHQIRCFESNLGTNSDETETTRGLIKHVEPLKLRNKKDTYCRYYNFFNSLSAYRKSSN